MIHSHGVDRFDASREWLRLEIKGCLFENYTKLTSHLARIARDLANHVAFELGVVARTVERHSHAPARSLRGDDPRMSDSARIARRHDLASATFTEAPLGGAGGVDDPLKFATT